MQSLRLGNAYKIADLLNGAWHITTMRLLDVAFLILRKFYIKFQTTDVATDATSTESHNHRHRRIPSMIKQEEEEKERCQTKVLIFTQARMGVPSTSRIAWGVASAM